jgi:UrcA family protein
MFNANKITSAVVALAILAPLPAMAETVSVSVRYADLNLASAEGQQAFNRRIAAAGRQICGAVDSERDLSRRASINRFLCLFLTFYYLITFHANLTWISSGAKKAAHSTFCFRFCQFSFKRLNTSF